MPASLFPTTTYDLLKDQYNPLISVPDAARIVGNHTSTWYKWMDNGLMPVPSILMGKSHRIRLIDLCAYIDAQASVDAPLKPKREPTKQRGRPRKFDPALSLSHS